MVDKYFNTIEERDLWLILNAHEQIHWEKNLTWDGKPTHQALNHRNIDEALKVARNQLNFDINHDRLRSTIDEYIKNGKSEFVISLRREKIISNLLKEL
jgi:hypothetical protein